MKTFYRRHLPHWQPEGQVFFVTFRLFGSLPKFVLECLKIKRERLHREPPRADESPRDKALRDAKRLFALADDALAEELHQSGNDSMHWLDNPEIAGLVQVAIKIRDGKQYNLHRYVVMPNHVHLLIKPLPIVGRVDNPSYWPLSEIMRGLKRWTARETNRLLGRTGSFWQDESFDHCVRERHEYNRIIRYIDVNPIKAGLCAEPFQWRWSSAADDANK